MLKLPDVKELSLISAKEESVSEGLQKTEDILKRLMLNVEAFKKIEENNKKLRLMLIKNQELLKKDFYSKLNEVKTSFEQKAKQADENHKNLLKQHEQIKLDFKKNIVIEKDKNSVLRKKHKELYLALKTIREDNLLLKEINEKIISKLKFLEQKSLANEKLLEQRTNMIKHQFEDKLLQMTKQLVNKEIEYKSKIESLKKDLHKYYSALRDSKKEFHNREEELRKKFKEILK